MTEEELRKLLEKPEDPHIEFKRSLPSHKEITEYAVGMGNSGGGRLIVGAGDARPRTIHPLDPPPTEEDIETMRKSIAESAQIHIGIESIATGQGAVLVFSFPTRPRGIPFHTRDGKYKVRVGGQLRGMTIHELDAIRKEAGFDITGNLVPGSLEDLLDPAGLEELRGLMKETRAPEDLASLRPRDLLESLELYSRTDGLTIAGLLLAGKKEAIRIHAPFSQWQFFHMKSDTEYDQSESGNECIATALRRLRELIMLHNPIVTIEGWLLHPEFPRYPITALRELLVNALVHRDYAVPGSVTVKVYGDKLEISNPGGFIGGVSASNILHHSSAPRYPALFFALSKIRLANAANLGIPRIYRDLLSEGKEPPIHVDFGGWIKATVKGQETRKNFLDFIGHHEGIDVDDLLIVHYLTRHREIDSRRASEICQRDIREAEEILSRLAHKDRILESGGKGRGRYFRLSRSSYETLLGSLEYSVDKRLLVENARARVLAVLAEKNLTNQEVREITLLGRNQALWLMKGLQKEGLVALEGSKKASRWTSTGKY